jgi:hypothetical protein
MTKRYDNYYHKRLGPVSRLERKIEKTPAAKTLDNYSKKADKVAKVGLAATAVATTATAAALGIGIYNGLSAVHGGPEIPNIPPEYRDPYFIKAGDEIKMKDNQLNITEAILSGAAPEDVTQIIKQKLGEAAAQKLAERKAEIAATLLADILPSSDEDTE